MKITSKTAIVLWVLILFPAVGCVANQPRLDATNQTIGRQAITGHEVVFSGETRSTVKLTTTIKVPGGNSVELFIPRKVMDRQSKVVNWFFHGDDTKKKFKKNPGRALRNARLLRLNEDPIVPIRPHSWSKQDIRSRREMELFRAIVLYINNEFGVKEHRFFGHSGGGIIAAYLTHELPAHVNVVGAWLSAPKLAVKIHYRRYEGGLPRDGRASRQYDPYDNVEKLKAFPDRTIFAVYAKDDRVMNSGGILPYFKKAESLGLGKQMKVVRVSGRHGGAIKALGRELRKEENRNFWVH